MIELYYKYSFLLESDCLLSEEKEDFRRVSEEMPEVTATIALHRLSKLLY